MFRRLAPWVASLVLAGVAAGPARAQNSGPLAPLPSAPARQAPPAQTAPAPAPAPSGSTDGGLSSGVQALIFATAALLLAGIGWAIVRDARRAAPVTDHGERPRPDRRTDRARARAKARAARRQRKRNR